MDMEACFVSFKPRITKIGVGGFKSIKSLQPLDLGPVTVFIGANGAGKSNLISLFRLLNALSQSRLQLFVGKAGGADTLLYYGAKETFLWVTLEFEAKTGSEKYYFQLARSDTDGLAFSQEQVIRRLTRSSEERPRQLGSGQRESLLTLEGGDFPEFLDLLKGIQVFHFHDTSETAPIRRRSYIHDNRCLHGDGGNLPAFLYGLKKSREPYYDRIVKTIRLIAPFFDDFDLEPLREDPNSVLLNWRDRDSNHLFGPHQLSDGTLRAMALVALLLQPEGDLPGLIVLDEPEIGLHPHAIEIVAELLRSASVHRPVVIATQSVGLVNHFNASEIVTVTRENSQSKFVRPDPDFLKIWLEDYAVGEIWEKNLIGGTPSR
jgi:predicted ATPase